MRNFVHPGRTLPLTAPSGGVVSGVGYKIGAIIAIASVTADEGAPFEGAVEGVFDVAAEGAGSGQAWAVGDLVYYDAANKRFTKTSTSNTLAGYAVGVKATAGVVGRLRLVPTI